MGNSSMPACGDPGRWGVWEHEIEDLLNTANHNLIVNGDAILSLPKSERKRTRRVRHGDTHIPSGWEAKFAGYGKSRRGSGEAYTRQV
jgi:hypothetical protein